MFVTERHCASQALAGGHLIHADPLSSTHSLIYLTKTVRITPIISKKGVVVVPMRWVQEAQDRDRGSSVSIPPSSCLTCTVLTLTLGRRSPWRALPLARPLKMWATSSWISNWTNGCASWRTALEAEFTKPSWRFGVLRPPPEDSECWYAPSAWNFLFRRPSRIKYISECIHHDGVSAYESVYSSG